MILGKVQQLVNVELVYCLQMCHKTVEESHLDTSLIFSYAKGEQVVSLEEIISATHSGRGREGITARPCTRPRQIPLQLHRQLRADSDMPGAPRPAPGDRGRGVQGQLDAEVWEEINASCIEHQEFWLAQICALHVIVLPDELEELIGSYE